MQPELCKPSHEAHQTSSFKKYLPNLTAFKKSSRRWTTGFNSKDLSKKKYAAQTSKMEDKGIPNE